MTKRPENDSERTMREALENPSSVPPLDSPQVTVSLEQIQAWVAGMSDEQRAMLEVLAVETRAKAFGDIAQYARISSRVYHQREKAKRPKQAAAVLNTLNNFANELDKQAGRFGGRGKE